MTDAPDTANTTCSPFHAAFEQLPHTMPGATADATRLVRMSRPEYHRAHQCWVACDWMPTSQIVNANASGGLRTYSHEVVKALEQQRDVLLAAVQRTVIENRHLADGEHCTLRPLTRALEQIGMQP